MYFKKLEIFGFKSFADKTAMQFGPGITAIIGPNGCGKSNVSDAIRWVLGEQSVKELRGSSMEDVIFNGTDKKPALGFAEVSLSFSNESRIFPIEYDEVTVTRRLFRSGESEYQLNKTTVRLKDITELFMGTGIGAEAYSLVQQGKVDLVVSAKPEERRIVLDEASGITKYKSKRREALNKLKDTEGNLLRINDIITEVKRQISSLERQASKARRYKEEFEKLKNFEVKLANIELGKFDGQRCQLQLRREVLKGQEGNLLTELESFQEQLMAQDAQLEDLEEKINEVNSEDIKLDGQIDISNRQIGFNEERLTNIAQTQERIARNKEQLLERCRVHQSKIEEVREALASLDETLRTNQQILIKKKEQLQQIASSIRESEKAIQDEERNILEITSNQVQIKNRLTDVMKDVQGALARKRRLEMENIKVTQEKDEIDGKLRGVLFNIQQTSDRINARRAELADRRRMIEQLKMTLRETEGQIDTLEKKKLFLISQKEFIERLSTQYQDIPDPVVEGRLLMGTAPLPHQSGIIGKVKNVFQADPARLETLRAQFPDIGQELYEVICEAKFIELDPHQISAQIDGLESEIQKNIGRKEAIAAELKEHYSHLDQFAVDIQETEKTLSIYESQRNDMSGESVKVVEELELVNVELDEVAAILSAAKDIESELSSQLDTLSRELGKSQTTIRDKQDQIGAKQQEREETSVQVAQLETEVSLVSDKRKSHEDNLAMFQETLDGSLEEIQRLETEGGELEGKKRQFQADIDSLREGIDKLKEQKYSLRSVLADYEHRRDEVIQKTNSLRAQVIASNKELEDIRNQLHDQQLIEQEIGYKEKEINDRLLQSYRIDLDAYNQQAAQVPVPLEGAAPAPEQPSAKPEEQFNSLEELKEVIERLRKRCESFGSVNLVAIEEFDDLRQRFEFLTKQQSDLITAKEQLHSTISKINRQTRQMFMDTFTKVSEEFRIYFRMLFGGGDAQLVLLDPENVLESGIDIIARPPGKKLQNISLLSGGEKTLTAIALIFGVFKVNPSPFCVLDEIDAALDESNVGRFAYLLRDFSKIAQFIVITHNKKTIASADVMYGVTMQETGVSKIVSVKFKEKDEKEKVAEEKVLVGA